MTDMTAERAQELLDGATPGPWLANGEPWNLIVWSATDNRVCFMAHSNGLDDDRDVATAELVAAAPDLARAYIAQAAELEATRKREDDANAAAFRHLAELTRLRAKVEAADKLAEAASAFAGWDQCWPGNINLEAVKREIVAALSVYEEAREPQPTEYEIKLAQLKNDFPNGI